MSNAKHYEWFFVNIFQRKVVKDIRERYSLFGFEGSNLQTKQETHKTSSVMMRLGDTPVPIPNTTVKTQAVDGTWWAAAWESRWSPKSYGLIAQLVRAHA